MDTKFKHNKVYALNKQQFINANHGRTPLQI